MSVRDTLLVADHIHVTSKNTDNKQKTFSRKSQASNWPQRNNKRLPGHKNDLGSELRPRRERSKQQRTN